jgi:hypothetical protein
MHLGGEVDVFEDGRESVCRQQDDGGRYGTLYTIHYTPYTILTMQDDGGRYCTHTILYSYYCTHTLYTIHYTMTMAAGDGRRALSKLVDFPGDMKVCVYYVRACV